MNNFLSSTPTAPVLFARSYSRWTENGREKYSDVVQRCVAGLTNLGKLTPSESQLIRSQMEQGTAFPSGRYLWCGGTEWSQKSANYYGEYNCSSTEIDSVEAFAHIMNLAMCGCGTGSNLEPRNIEKLPTIVNRLEVEVIGKIGSKESISETIFEQTMVGWFITVGDSRKGWIDSYIKLIELATNTDSYNGEYITFDLSHIRSSGQRLKGFGGVSNPIKLPELYTKVTDILNGAVGRKLTVLECCMLIDEAALVVVAGNIRRSAGIKQFSETEPNHKQNLWVETDGVWSIDPKRDALRMSNHTRVFHQKPTLSECIESVNSQYESGEGAIMWAGEAVARANADILNTRDKLIFLKEYDRDVESGRDYLEFTAGELIPTDELNHRMNRYGLNPCGEITGSNFLCNLSDVHLNRLDPLDLDAQKLAFEAAAIEVCCLLHHEFEDERYRASRELDPIVGVSFTGLFDFFVNSLGVDWIKWWQAGRPKSYFLQSDGIDKIIEEHSFNHNDFFIEKKGINAGELFNCIERSYLSFWQETVTETVTKYCTRHNLKVPNRCTTVQPSGSKSLLTGASPGWHPPKAQRYIRRITFAKNDPIAMAAIDYGYTVIPSQSDKDNKGNLLDDPFDTQCTEWLVEVPSVVSWADLPGASDVDLGKFSALAQFDFYMQVQQFYTQHNSSATIELREDEIVELATRIYESIQNDEGYISAALLSRIDTHQSYPRLPFEPIDKDTYDDLMVGVKTRRLSGDFDELLAKYDLGIGADGSSASGCDSDKCLLG